MTAIVARQQRCTETHTHDDNAAQLCTIAFRYVQRTR